MVIAQGRRESGRIKRNLWRPTDTYCHTCRFFASDFGGNFTTDFTSITGNEWDAFFGNSAAGNPNGMVNRVGYPSSDHIITALPMGAKSG